MKRVICFLLVSICFLATASDLFATHNRAGEITYRHDPLPGEKFRYFFEIVTFTKTSSIDADRDSLDVSWGDGSFERVGRVNGPGQQGEIIPGASDLKRNVYQAHHTYPGPFTYVVTMTDPNRIDDILNINFGESEGISFTLIDTLFILDDEFFGFNDSPVLNQPPVDVANRGFPFIHNPNAFDPDGDSLHFELVPPIEFTQGDVFTPVPNYILPNQVIPIGDNLPPSGNPPPGPEYNFTINPNNGEIFWDAPWEPGFYNIAILIREFRAGFPIGTLVRDMQIEVLEAPNQPPVLAELLDTCVTVGDNLVLEVSASDPDSDRIELTATGFPFEADFTSSLATFVQNVDVDGEAEGVFEWSPGCDEIFSTAYQVVFKGEDNFTQLPLVDLETWFINVIAPPPTGLSSSVANGVINLAWDDDYVCENTDKFLGFGVWRRLGCDSLELDNCSDDLANFGYELIADQVMGNTYADASADPGLTYSYRVTAEFTDVSTSGGVPLNFGFGLPSNNSCETLPSDVPLMTNVDVQTTGQSSGSIFVQWTKPDGAELDTMIFTGPYIYELFRNDGSNETMVQSFSSNTFFEANDTSFVDTGLNTLELEYTYFIRFNSGTQLIGNSETASSIFLNLSSGDSSIELVWDEQVPWINNSYDIFRRTPTGSTFDFLATTDQQFYLDQGLENGEEYCYFVESSGSYFTDGILDPLINKSQESCAIAIDTEPPCNPDLVVRNDCENDSNIWNFENRLTWSVTVGCLEDVAGYNVFYRGPLDIDFQIIAVISDPNTFQFTHVLDNSISGCYFVTAFDQFDNESTGSNEVCVENCALYELPNAFTPNGDGANEIFTPLDGFRFVNQVDLKIYNRWGGLVFETSDPFINWDGTDSNSGDELSGGVYFYVVRIIEGNEGNEILGEQQSGYIHLLRSE